MSDEVEKKRRGAPSKINPARIAKMLKSMQDGNFFKVAAVSNGVTENTAYRWRKTGDAALAAAKLVNPEIEDELDDWLQVYPDNFNVTNDMWDAPVPEGLGLPRETWLCVLFSILTDRALARAEVKALARLRGGKPGWQSAAWYLERTHIDRWGRNQTIAHTGANGGPIEVEGATPEAVLARIEELRVLRAQGA